MKRLALAVAIMAAASACKKADEQPAQSADTTQMMADSTKMMGDTTKMAGDTTKRM